MKALAILQIIFGALAAFVAWGLAAAKAGITEMQTPFLSPDGTLIIKTDSPPPSYFFEFVLLFLGLAILTCGFLQKKKDVEHSVAQIVNGVIISVISGFLAISAIAINHGRISGDYYLAYVAAILGFAVFVIGIRQLTHVPAYRKYQ
jgi:hypothetical protein